MLPLPTSLVDDHFAAGLLGEAEYLRQAEPGALADLLGGEERFEDALELLLRNADAGIGDRYRDITVGFADGVRGACAGNSVAVRTVIVSRPWPSMASRALTAMLIIAVSNWPASALMKHGSSGPCVTISMREPISVPIISLSIWTLWPTSNSSGFNVCRRANASNWPGQPGGARHRVRDRIDVAQPPRLRQIRPPQQIDGGADHREQIVEVMRDAAGELPQRLQPLAMFQRFLGLQPLVGFENRDAASAARPSASRTNSSAVAGAPKIRCWLMVESQRARIAEVSRPALI